MENTGLLDVIESDFRILDETQSHLYTRLSNNLESIMSDPNNPALLARDADYFMDQMETNDIIVFLDNNNEIVATGGALELKDGVYEYGSIYVREDYRGKEMGKEILQELNSKTHHDLGILTVKPNEPGNAGMIIDGIKAGFIPVPFNSLEIYNQEAYTECCCCDSFVNGSCNNTDNYCILLVENKNRELFNDSIGYLKSQDFNTSVLDEGLRNKILEEFYIINSDNYSDELNDITNHFRIRIENNL